SRTTRPTRSRLPSATRTGSRPRPPSGARRDRVGPRRGHRAPGRPCGDRMLRRRLPARGVGAHAAHGPEGGRGGPPAHAPRGTRRRDAALRLRLGGGARVVPHAGRRPERGAEGGAVTRAGGIRTPGVERLQAASPRDADEELDRSLRPRHLTDFVGQRQVAEQLAVFIEAARGRGEPLDHVLLAGPPGLGKTSLAQIVAAELEVPITPTAGPALERKGDVAASLTALETESVFFVDEIHRLPRALEETFYPAMEDRRLPITVGQGAGARVVTLDLPPFTLIGATTRAGLLTTPLRDRFGVTLRLELYPP